jgi:hypothetical protein
MHSNNMSLLMTVYLKVPIYTVPKAFRVHDLPTLSIVWYPQQIPNFKWCRHQIHKKGNTICEDGNGSNFNKVRFGTPHDGDITVQSKQPQMRFSHSTWNGEYYSNNSREYLFYLLLCTAWWGLYLVAETCNCFSKSNNKYGFHSRIVHLDIIKVLLPTDAQENSFKRSITIYIKTAPTCFGVITIIRKRTIWACKSYFSKLI